MRQIYPLGRMLALLALTACSASETFGLRAPKPDSALLRPCARPALAPGPKDQAQIEIALGRIGSDLITCAQRHAALAQWAIKQTAIVGPQK